MLQQCILNLNYMKYEITFPLFLQEVAKQYLLEYSYRDMKFNISVKTPLAAMLARTVFKIKCS